MGIILRLQRSPSTIRFRAALRRFCFILFTGVIGQARKSMPLHTKASPTAALCFPTPSFIELLHTCKPKLLHATLLPATACRCQSLICFTKILLLRTFGQILIIPNTQMGGCQNYGPFLDPYYSTAPTI